jgi:hypothetical protein
LTSQSSPSQSAASLLSSQLSAVVVDLGGAVAVAADVAVHVVVVVIVVPFVAVVVVVVDVVAVVYVEFGVAVGGVVVPVGVLESSVLFQTSTS